MGALHHHAVKHGGRSNKKLNDTQAYQLQRGNRRHTTHIHHCARFITITYHCFHVSSSNDTHSYPSWHSYCARFVAITYHCFHVSSSNDTQVYQSQRGNRRHTTHIHHCARFVTITYHCFHISSSYYYIGEYYLLVGFSNGTSRGEEQAFLLELR